MQRQDAYSALTKLAFEQERFYAQNQNYTAVLSALNPTYNTTGDTFQTNERDENNYSVQVTATSDTYHLVATAINGQVNDTYSQFTLNHLGQQTRTDAKSGAVENKWQ